MFKFHYPARGRKLYKLLVPAHTIRVQIPFPRKGTETPEGTSALWLGLWLGFNSITPQGDGNNASDALAI